MEYRLRTPKSLNFHDEMFLKNSALNSCDFFPTKLDKMAPPYIQFIVSIGKATEDFNDF